MRLGLVSLCLLSLGCASQSVSTTSSRNPSSMISSRALCKSFSRMEIHAHRGAWDRPENMITAFVRSVEQGADFVEMDLQISKDNEVIVAHDAFMKPECVTSQGKAPANRLFYRNMTVPEIKTYDCGSKVTRGQPVPGEKISTLAEVIAALKDKKTARGVPLRLNIEIKYNPTQPQYYPSREFYVDRILEVIDRSGIDMSQVMIQSFDIDTLRVVRQKRPYVRLAPLLSDVKDGVRIAQELNAELVTPHYGQVSPEMLRLFHTPTSVHPQGIKVVPWTVNTPEEANKLIEWGADGLITDFTEWITFAKSFCN